MKKLLTLLFVFIGLQTFAQVGSFVSIPLGAWPYTRPAWLQLPDDYASTSTKYPVIIFGHGAGEASGTGATDVTYQAGGYLNKIYNSSSAGGPAYFIEHSAWPSYFTNPKDGLPYKFIILSPQKEGSWGFYAGEMYKYIDWLKANYRVDTNRIYVTGLSAGGEAIIGYESNYDIEAGTSITRSTLPAAAVPMSAATGAINPAWAQSAVADSIPNWGFGSPASDTHGGTTQDYINDMNAVKSGYSRFTNYAGGHCCWGTYYNPTYTESVNGTTMNIYQWMLTNTRAAAGFVAPPTVNAGIDQSTTANNVSVSGTAGAASGYSITTYAWTKTSGGSATIVSPSSISTTITGLSVGTYVFRLTVTQSDGQTAYDELTVTVSSAPAFTVNAGADTTIESTVNAIILHGSCSDGSATFIWRPLNKPPYLDEACNIINPTSATTGVMTLPWDWYGFYDFELAATVGATTIKDTVRVITHWDMTGTNQASPAIRMVTSGDVTTYPGMVIGDAIVAGANDGPSFMAGNKTDIYIQSPAGISVGAGHHVWLLAGNYNDVKIRFDSGQLVGTPSNPVTITNYGGQFKARRILFENLGKNVKLTGKYVAGVSGDVNYKGHDSSYAFSRGKYGIWINQYWQTLNAGSLSILGYCQNLDISYVEAGDGGFAGVFMNTGNDHVWDSINFNRLYIHNTDGEGNYLGHTGDTSVVHNFFTNSTYENNRVLYTGNEILQWGQLGINNVAKNNVLIGGGMRWRTSFEAYFQANSLQLGIRSSGNKFINNILRGAGDQNINVFLQPYSKIPIGIGLDSILIANNYVGDSRSFIGNYINPGNGFSTVGLAVRNNYFSNYNFQGDSIYTNVANSAGVNTNYLVKFDNGSQTNTGITFKNNTFDATKTGTYFGNTTNTVNTGNTQTTIYKPVFVNSGWDDNFDWTRLEAWTDSLFQTYGDEYGSLAYTKAPAKAYYQIGDWVTFQSKYYTSKINNNTGHMPTGMTDAYWQKMTWTDGVKTYDYPPDDFRLQTGDNYNIKGIGLLDNMSNPGALPIIIRNFFVTKHKYKDAH